MGKPVITLVASNYDVASTNTNFAAIADYIENNLLHRDGEPTPSPMAQAIDVNGHNIINVGYATELDHAVPLRQLLEIASGDNSSIEDIDFPEE